MEKGGRMGKEEVVSWEAGYRKNPEVYILPKHSLRSNLALYGSMLVLGIGAGLLVDSYIKAKVAEDGGYITFGKKKEDRESKST